MPLIQGKPPTPGYSHIVGPDDSDLEHIDFGLLWLPDQGAWEGEFPGREALLVVLGGQCDIEAGGRTWRGVGRRADIFDGKASAVYLPPGAPCRVAGRPEVEIAVASAPASKRMEERLIAPEDVGVRAVGEGASQREVCDIARAGDGAGERLLAGETYSPSGLWSSYPPHKHDTQRPPEESKLEEVYHFRVKPARGFGIQRVYGDGFDDAYALQDRDTVAITKGYHPVAAAPGYQLYYLWILAGEERVMHWWEDPSHSWVSSQA
jgi:5-deoxy-glucuronate isomerase